LKHSSWGTALGFRSPSRRAWETRGAIP
jgi:hypothetical protein